MKRILLIAGVICLVATACYEDVEGCLNPNAANYDLDADVQCSNNCCQFPNLNIQIDHRYGSERLAADSFYVNANNDSFRIVRLRYYWSDLALIGESGERLEPQESIDVGLVQSTGDTVLTPINDNLNLFNSTSTQAREIGSFQATESFTGFTGLIGIEDDYQLVAPATAPSNHPLGFQEGRMYYGLDTGYVSFKLEYELIVDGDTLSRELNAYGTQPLNIDFGSTVALTRGFAVTLNFNAAIDDWLQGLNLAATEEELVAVLSERLANIFILTEIVVG